MTVRRLDEDVAPRRVAPRRRGPEGPAFAPVPAMRRPVREYPFRGVPAPRAASEPSCELCGHPVIATHCKRICLKCGFMTGCSEGI